MWCRFFLTVKKRTPAAARPDCSHRTYEDSTVEDPPIVTLAAFGIATLSRDCGEQLQLTSPDVPEGGKLYRVALTAPGVQRALKELSGLAAPLYVKEAPALSSAQCWNCSARLQTLDDPRWLECSLTYRRYALEAGGRTETILDYYATFCLCWECGKETSLPMPEAMDEAGQELAYGWTATVVWLLGYPLL